MRRKQLLIGLVIGIVLLPTAAFAKGEPQAADGRVTITGPGLVRPIRLSGEAAGFGGEIFHAEDSEFAHFLQGTPLFAFEPGKGWFGHVPDDLAALGPAFTISYRFEFEDGTITSATHALYPYAPDRPLIHIPADVGLHGRNVELWWRVDMPRMLRILRGHGLPTDTPEYTPPPQPPVDARPDAGATAQAAVGATDEREGSSRTWVSALLASALALLVAAGVLAGRRRRAPAAETAPLRPAPPPGPSASRR